MMSCIFSKIAESFRMPTATFSVKHQNKYTNEIAKGAISQQYQLLNKGMFTQHALEKILKGNMLSLTLREKEVR